MTKLLPRRWIIPFFGWRWYAASCALPSLILPMLRFNIPESPRFLYSQNRPDDAMKVIQQVAVINDLPDFPEDITLLPPKQLLANNMDNNEATLSGKEMNDSMVSTAGEFQIHSSWQDIFAASLKKSTLLLWCIWFLLSFAYRSVLLIWTYLTISDVQIRYFGCSL